MLYHNRPKTYESLKKLDAQFQLNLLSSVGYYGTAVANTTDFLLKEDFIAFVGSDVHHMRHYYAFHNKLVIKSEKQQVSAI